MEETTSTKRRRLQLTTGTLTYPLEPELPTLPVDLLPEILCRLPVKLLVQLRCLCKFFNSLISDPKFAKKHLRISTKCHHLMLANVLYDYDYELVMYDSPIPSVFSTSTVFTQTQLYIPSTLTNRNHVVRLMCCCDGMFCGKLNNGSYFVWNPSIRKFKLLPPLENHKLIRTLSFGYDHFIDNYKVVAVSDENEVCVNTFSMIPQSHRFFSTSTVVTQTQLYIPNGHDYLNVLCCCDGMFCGKLKHGSYFVWNPSITKFKLLPPLESDKRWTSISFGYDHFIDNYKLIVVSFKNEVFVYTLGTDYWTRIEDIPYSDNICGQGVFVSGTLNWLANGHSSIISLDLKKELYQNLSLPDSKIDSLTLGVVRNCLCIFASRDMFLDVWIMNEYGNEKSWTKLYTVPSLQDYNFKAYNVLYISDHNQLLVECYEMGSGRLKLVVYDSKTGTLNSPEFQNNYEYTKAKVYVESLISP